MQDYFRTYLYRDSIQTAYVWEVYEDCILYSLHLNINPIFIEAHTRDAGVVIIDRVKVPEYLDSSVTLHIDIRSSGSKLVQISVDTCDKIIQIYCGPIFGHVYYLPRKYYDDFVIWIKYVFSQYIDDHVI